MNNDGHEFVTRKAFEILRSLNSNLNLLNFENQVAERSYTIDKDNDMEFVNVEGGYFGSGVDNPHVDEWDEVDDIPHYTEEGHHLTTYNHFIDIKKGPGIFDDFDGYSYRKGSASKGEYQDASDAADSKLAKILAQISDQKVDEGVNWWFNDEYVHTPAHKWYRACSPAVERYSFPLDKGVYKTINEELKERFPMAESTGTSGKGIPYSVFMPVDNLARYWYNKYMTGGNAIDLGPVFHAIHDASIPHHAAGYTGNWHGRYENDIDKQIAIWSQDASFNNEVKQLFETWYKHSSSAPSPMGAGNWVTPPSKDWRIDSLVTWVALNAYNDYANVYNHFKSGYSFNQASARKLTILAAAMTLLVLAKCANYTLPVVIENNTTEEKPPAPKEVPLILVTPGSVNFGIVASGTSKTETIKISNVGLKPLTIESIGEPTGVEFSFQTTPTMPKTLDVEESINITFKFTKPSKDVIIKTYQSTCTIKSNADNNKSVSVRLFAGPQMNNSLPELDERIDSIKERLKLRISVLDRTSLTNELRELNKVRNRITSETLITK